MPIEQMISICECKKCKSTLFESVEAAIIQQNENGTYNPVITTLVYRCLECGTMLKPKRISGIGQVSSIKRTIHGLLPDGTTDEPGSKRVDLGELTGTKKKPLRVPGGLTGANMGFPSAK